MEYQNHGYYSCARTPIEPTPSCKKMRDYLPPSPFDAQYSSNFVTHSNFGIQSNWQNFPPNFKYNSPHEPPSFYKAHANFKQFENEGIGHCWERYLELMNSFPQHKFEPWQVISRFYNLVTEKTRQDLDMLSEENFLEIEPILAMIALDNHIGRKIPVPCYENFDVYYSWEEYLYSSVCASSFFDFSMVRQDQKSSKDVLIEYLKYQVDMMNEANAIMFWSNLNESIYQTTQVLDQFEPDTIMPSDMVDDDEEIVHLDLPLTENSDELEVTNLFTIAQDFEFDNFDEMVHECINNELTNSKKVDDHQTHLEHIENTPYEYEIEGKPKLENDSMHIQPEEEIVYHGLKEINLEKLLNIGSIFIFGFSHFDDFLDSFVVFGFNKVKLLTFLRLVTFTFVIVIIKKNYKWVIPFVMVFEKVGIG